MNPGCCHGVVSDELCGRHSGIPPCCRAWFAVWTAFIRADPYGDPPSTLEDWHYVPCPGCRQCGARVRVRDCGSKRATRETD